VLGIYTHADV